VPDEYMSSNRPVIREISTSDMPASFHAIKNLRLTHGFTLSFEIHSPHPIITVSKYRGIGNPVDEKKVEIGGFPMVHA